MAPLAHPLNPPLGNALKNDHPAILLQSIRKCYHIFIQSCHFISNQFFFLCHSNL